MSLHCPATIVLVPADASPTDQLLAALAQARIAATYAAPDTAADGADPAAGTTGADAAAGTGGAWATAATRRFGAPPRVLAGLAATDAGEARVAVETIADVHRGEHVLALVPAGWLPDVVARLVATTTTIGPGPVVLECGDDGWFLRSWAPDTTPSESSSSKHSGSPR